MKGHAAARHASEPDPAIGKEMNQYHSVMFSLRGADNTYRSRVWDKATSSMHLLIEETSDLLSRLKVGDTVNMKYYSYDLRNPSEYLEASVQHITKKDRGRLKGHYLVGLDIKSTQ
jgi:hypothetical protein